MRLFNLPATLVALTLLNPLESLLIESIGYLNMNEWDYFDLMEENEVFKL